MFSKLIFIILFFFNEIKLIKYRSKLILGLIKEISFFRLIKYFFFKDSYPFKNQNLNEYLKKNKRFVQDHKINSDKKIFVDLTLNTNPLYAINNCYMAIELAKFRKLSVVGNIIRNDYVTYFIAKSFGIKNFIFIDEGNLLTRIFYFIKSLYFIPENKIAKNIVNLTLEKIEIGKASYEHAIRNFKYSPLKKNNFLLYLALSKSLRSFYLSTKNGIEIESKMYKVYIQGDPYAYNPSCQILFPSLNISKLFCHAVKSKFEPNWLIQTLKIIPIKENIKNVLRL